MFPPRWFPRFCLALTALAIVGGGLLTFQLAATLETQHEQRLRLHRERAAKPDADGRSSEDALRESFEGGRRSAVTNLAVGLLLLAIATAVVAWLLFRGVARTAAALVSAAEKVAAGNLDVEVAADRHDEFGRLAARFNTMTNALDARFTKQKSRAQELEGREEFLQAVLATMVEAVVAVDGDQRILFANRASRKLLGMNQKELVGRPIWEAARSPVLQETLHKVLTESALQRIEFQLPRTKRIVVLSASRLPGTPPPGAVLMFHDVTELRQLENLRREFVSNVSHELKTPLTTIQAYAETLLDGALDDPQHSRDFVQRIAEQGDRLHGLILDLLALARIEAEDQAFDMRPIAVGKVVEQSFLEHYAVGVSKGLEMTCFVGDAQAQVLADAEGLRTILDNLLDNALNHTPPGGKVDVQCDTEGETVRLQVTDTGIGIAREHHDRIFERFYRVDKARSRELGGTGLGLSIVKHLTQMFGGSVSVMSSPGKGSTFTVELPLLEQ